MGIFGVSMPLLYGEEGKAFERLQKEIIRTTTDQSIFAWKFPVGHTPIQINPLLAPYIDCFEDCNDIFHCPGLALTSHFELTNMGLRVSVPIIELPRDKQDVRHGAVLNCRRGGTVIVLTLLDYDDPHLPLPVCRTTFDSNSELRIHHVGIESIVRAEKQEIIIKAGSSEPSTYGGLDGEYEPYGVWLRVKQGASGGKLQLHTPTPPESWDILHLDIAKCVEVHAHLGGDPQSRLTCGAINFSYGTCTWQITINHTYAYKSVPVGFGPVLAISHLGPCHSQIAALHEQHRRIEWQASEYESSMFDTIIALPEKSFNLDDHLRLRITFSHEETMSTQYTRELILELILESAKLDNISNNR
jgi:hypothetical protein